MKTIMIATDFSKASRNASLYGVQLAKAMNAKIILFAAYQPAHPIAALNVRVSHFDVRMHMEKRLADEAHAIKDPDGPEIGIVCEEGPPGSTILAIAKEKQADLIIAGMDGHGKNVKRLFGSTAVSLIKDSDIPVIVVPEEATFSRPKEILYASDVFLDITIRAIDQIKWITDCFDSNLHVVRVMKDDYEALREGVNLPRKLRAGLAALHASFQFPVNADVGDGLSDFIKEQKIDLLVMSPHKHEWIAGIFVKSKTKDMAFRSQVALLVLAHAPAEVKTAGAIQAVEVVSMGK